MTDLREHLVQAIMQLPGMTRLMSARAADAALGVIEREMVPVRDYQAGMSAADYQRVQQWIAAGCPKSPEQAFTAGPARQAARLIVEAREMDAAGGRP
ncbi:MAG: hypothetical protein AB7F35_20315 [Acetobacteraceae bacterium]